MKLTGILWVFSVMLAPNRSIYRFFSICWKWFQWIHSKLLEVQWSYYCKCVQARPQRVKFVSHFAASPPLPPPPPQKKKKIVQNSNWCCIYLDCETVHGLFLWLYVDRFTVSPAVQIENPQVHIGIMGVIMFQIRKSCEFVFSGR